MLRRFRSVLLVDTLRPNQYCLDCLISVNLENSVLWEMFPIVSGVTVNGLHNYIVNGYMSTCMLLWLCLQTLLNGFACAGKVWGSNGFSWWDGEESCNGRIYVGGYLTISVWPSQSTTFPEVWLKVEQLKCHTLSLLMKLRHRNLGLIYFIFQFHFVIQPK